MSGDHEDYGELETELQRLADSPNLVFAEFYYWTRKLQAHFFAGDLASARSTLRARGTTVLTSAAMFESAEYRFYGALVHASAWDRATAEHQPGHLESVRDHYRQIEAWARLTRRPRRPGCPGSGRDCPHRRPRSGRTNRSYEIAIRSARKYGFIQNEVANELAGCFYAARGFEKIAMTYLRDARHRYLRWGADGKAPTTRPDLSASRVSEPAADFKQQRY